MTPPVTDCIIQPNVTTGEVKPSGLTIGGRVSIVSISDSAWTPLPAVALEGRNALGIQNTSGVEIKLNYDSSVVGYIGVVMANQAERYYDITDSITIYARSSTGTVSVTVEELA